MQNAKRSADFWFPCTTDITFYDRSHVQKGSASIRFIIEKNSNAKKLHSPFLNGLGMIVNRSSIHVLSTV